jgi:predicted cation transporter
MAWQDIVIAIVQVSLALALLPSVFKKDKPALATSIMTGVLLTILAFTFATLSLSFSAFATMSGAALWYVLAVQKYLIKKHEKESKLRS